MLEKQKVKTGFTLLNCTCFEDQEIAVLRWIKHLARKHVNNSHVTVLGAP
jgi:hypothetical protein